MSEYLQHNIKAYIYRGEKHYIAECMEISVVANPTVLVMMELETADSVAWTK